MLKLMLKTLIKYGLWTILLLSGTFLTFWIPPLQNWGYTVNQALTITFWQSIIGGLLLLIVAGWYYMDLRLRETRNGGTCARLGRRFAELIRISNGLDSGKRPRIIH